MISRIAFFLDRENKITKSVKDKYIKLHICNSMGQGTQKLKGDIRLSFYT